MLPPRTRASGGTGKTRSERTGARGDRLRSNRLRSNRLSYNRIEVIRQGVASEGRARIFQRLLAKPGRAG